MFTSIQGNKTNWNIHYVRIHLDHICHVFICKDLKKHVSIHICKIHNVRIHLYLIYHTRINLSHTCHVQVYNAQTRHDHTQNSHNYQDHTTMPTFIKTIPYIPAHSKTRHIMALSIKIRNFILNSPKPCKQSIKCILYLLNHFFKYPIYNINGFKNLCYP